MRGAARGPRSMVVKRERSRQHLDEWRPIVSPLTRRQMTRGLGARFGHRAGTWRKAVPSVPARRAIRRSRVRTRRQMLVSSAAAVMAQVRPARSLERAVKVRVLPFGTVGWETKIVRRNPFDGANGFRTCRSRRSRRGRMTGSNKGAATSRAALRRSSSKPPHNGRRTRRMAGFGRRSRGAG
jgi:hypothetical protein